MGCKPSTPVVNAALADGGGASSKEHALAQRYKENLRGVGQTERQISKMQRQAMNDNDNNGGNATAKGKAAPICLGPKLDASGCLAAEEVARRTCCSISNKEVMLGNIKNTTNVQFAHWTQRGYYPDDPHKQNQDEFGTHLQFAGMDEDAMFAVYDGHGKHGHSCARFAQERLPKAVAKHARRIRCQKFQKSRSSGGQTKKGGGWDPKLWPLLSQSEYESCCQKAFLEVNQAMHDAPDVVDSLSGTTATTVGFHGDFVSVSNVGDSRVVLGHRVKDMGGNNVAVHCPGFRKRSSAPSSEEEKSEIYDELVQESSFSTSGGGAAVASALRLENKFERRKKDIPGTRILAIPLSRDQTPYRKDERDRVKALGASIMSIDQMQGRIEVHDEWGDMVLGETLDIEGDSPRIWVKGKDYPGCAFTRSLGDSMSESVGVNAVPEILSTQLTKNDEYLVIASDGIFEFLTNSLVMELCSGSESPLVACEKIGKAAYEQWLVHEKRTDDITIIVCFLQNHNNPSYDTMHITTERLVEAMPTMYGNRPSSMTVPQEMPLTVTPTEELSARNYVHEPAAVAYASEEAHALIVQSPPPPAPMTFDNTETVDFGFASLMGEAKSLDNATSKTVSITSREDDDQIMLDAHRPEKKGVDTEPSAAEVVRNNIRI